MDVQKPTRKHDPEQSTQAGAPKPHLLEALEPRLLLSADSVLPGITAAFGEGFDLFAADRPLLAGTGEPGQEFDAVERFPPAVFLDHIQPRFLGMLEGGEPTTTRRALPAPANRTALLAHARVHYAAVGVQAERASHGDTLTPSSAATGTR